MAAVRILGPGEPLPDVTAIGRGGAEVKLRELCRDAPLLLVFVRCTYCTGCMEYAGHLKEWTQGLRDANLTVALCLTEGWKSVHKWAESERVPMTVLADESRQASKALGIYKALGFDSFRQARPSAFLVAPGGTIRWSAVFPEDESKAPRLDDYVGLAAKLFGGGAAATGAA